MNFNLRKELQRNRDADPILGTPFTREQEERLRELIREEVIKILGSETTAARTKIGIGIEHSEKSLEEALERAAKKAGAIHVSDMHHLMQETSAAAAKQIRERDFTLKNVCSSAVDGDVLDRSEWDMSPMKIEHSIDPFTKTSIYYAKVEIQRKDRKVFDSPVGKYIELSGKPFKITKAKMNHFLDTNGHVSASAFILCEFEGNSYQSTLMS